MKTQLRIIPIWLATTVMLSWVSSAHARELNLSGSPLFLGTNVDPNVFFLLDDSLSMDAEILTKAYNYHESYWQQLGSHSSTRRDNGWWDSVACGYYGCSRTTFYYAVSNQDNGLGGGSAYSDPEAYDYDWRGHSSDFNLLYYNPDITYVPWQGTGLTNASFSSARLNPQSGETGYSYTRDLDGFVFEVAIDDHGYNGSYPDGPNDATDGPNDEVDIWDSRIRYTINDSSWKVETLTVPNAATMRAQNQSCNSGDATDSTPYEDCYGTTKTQTTYSSTDVNTWGRTLAEEQTNIANWFQYYRKRSFVAKGAIASVVTQQSSFRFGLTLTDDNASGTGGDWLFKQLPAASTVNYTAHNTDLLSSLFSYNWQSGYYGNFTYLRSGLQYVGRYYDNDLSYSDPIISECQQNFTLLLTDGYWNGNLHSDNPSSYIGDADGDGYQITVADVAQYYYEKDLSSLPDNVPTSLKDPNNKQHMVTFGIAFGVKGQLEDSDGDGIPDTNPSGYIDWGNPVSSDEYIPEKIDDLWHAAYNSRGTYVAAQRPDEVADAIADALQEVGDRVGAAASVAANTGSLRQGSRIYQARFDSSNWTGQLLAMDLTELGYIDDLPAWDAREVLKNQNYNTGREIITFNPDIGTNGRGIPFRFPSSYWSPSSTTDLSTGQLMELMENAPYSFTTTWSSRRSQNQNWGQALLNYIRGDRSNEGTSGYGFRSRSAVLADFIDSAPFYMGPPSARYADQTGEAPYSNFKSTWKDRKNVVFVGSNGGMLHAFDADNGTELLGYVPSKTYEKLDELAEVTYDHEFYVNASPIVVDTYMETADEWRSVLVGGMGQGGQAIYALNVTDPDNFDESRASNIVMWEFTDADDRDLGYTFGVPSIVRLANGRSAAVFGNGYNNTETTNDSYASTTGHAYLFIVDVETGSLIRKIDVGVGSTTTPNGLASPSVIDYDGDEVADYAYAGDLEGNMWKFDLTDPNPNNWDVAFKDIGNNPVPLFTTATGQPITARPQISLHPLNYGGFMVFFGTGKYIEIDDNSTIGQPTQSVYGVWDKNDGTTAGITRTSLLRQSITDQYQESFDLDGDGTEESTQTIREVSENAINYTSHLGWYLDLIPEKVEHVSNTDNGGERQVTNISLRSGRLLFTTMMPSGQTCEFGGSSYTMALDYLNGGKLSAPTFDLTGDESFSTSDSNASGVLSDGISSGVTVLNDPDNQSELVYFNSTDDSEPERARVNMPADAVGRLSWRQIK